MQPPKPVLPLSTILTRRERLPPGVKLSRARGRWVLRQGDRVLATALESSLMAGAIEALLRRGADRDD